MKDLAPHIYRQRLLIEGFYGIAANEKVIKRYFAHIVKVLKLRVYGDPVIHVTSGVGKESNQGYDAFVPLIDSGIYVGVWANHTFLSTIIYTCKKFDEKKALLSTKKFWKIMKAESKSF